jgi:hypothetical protein
MSKYKVKINCTECGKEVERYKKEEYSNETFWKPMIETYRKYIGFNSEVWVGVDFDQTLVQTNGLGEHAFNPGKPVKPILKLVKRLIKNNIPVKIFTARVDFAPETIPAVESWCLKYVGTKLPVTNIKSAGMFCLLDDRAYNVTPGGNIIYGK